MFSYTVLPQEGGRRTVRVLEKMVPEAPSGLLYRFLRTKKIRVNGKHPRPEQVLAAGDRIDVYITDEQAASLGYRPQGTDQTAVPQSDQPSAPQSDQPAAHKSGASGTSRVRSDTSRLSRIKPASFPAIPVVYEDDNLVLWNKPAGVLCQSDRSGAYSLSEYAADTLSAATYKAGVINRLDRGTTGLVLAARSLESAQVLYEMFRSHGCRKLYLALCEGECLWDEEMWLVHAFRKDSRKNTAHVKRLYTGAEEPDLYKLIAGSDADPVVCRARVLYAADGKTLFALELIGGRSHQLRAQIAEEGYPVLGDRKYGAAQAASGAKAPNHPLLHAYRLLFGGLSGAYQSYNGQVYTAKPPADFRQALSRMNLSLDTVSQAAGFTGQGPGPSAG